LWKLKRNRPVAIMKVIILLIQVVLILSTTTVDAQIFNRKAKIVNGTYEFDKNTHDFGDVIKKQKVIAEFVITNTSTTEYLIVRKVKTTCGCTVSKYDKESIPPGKSTIIKATFNGSGRGKFEKGLIVYTNFQKKPEILFLVGNVIRKKDAAKKSVDNENGKEVEKDNLPLHN